MQTALPRKCSTWLCADASRPDCKQGLHWLARWAALPLSLNKGGPHCLCPDTGAWLLQDDAEADAAEALLACAAVVDLAVPGGALLYASRGLEQLVGISLGSGSGSARGGPGLGALLEQGPGSEALRVAAKSGVPGGAAVALLRHDGSRRAPRTLTPKDLQVGPVLCW